MDENITITSTEDNYTITLTDAIKAGARNSRKDAERLQMIHDYARENGAKCKEEMREEGAVKAESMDMDLTT